MSNGSDDKKKIIINSEVNEVSARMIRAVARGELSREKVRKLAENDNAYLDNVRRIAPELIPNDREQ